MGHSVRIKCCAVETVSRMRSLIIASWLVPYEDIAVIKEILYVCTNSPGFIATVYKLWPGYYNLLYELPSRLGL